jgi:hypothetical protein
VVGVGGVGGAVRGAARSDRVHLAVSAPSSGSWRNHRGCLTRTALPPGRHVRLWRRRRTRRRGRRRTRRTRRRGGGRRRRRRRKSGSGGRRLLFSQHFDRVLAAPRFLLLLRRRIAAGRGGFLQFTCLDYPRLFLPSLWGSWATKKKVLSIVTIFV